MVEDRRRSVSRRDLDRNDRFSEISPELGQLDVDAFDELLDEDTDRALDLLAKMTQAMDRDLATLAKRLAGRLVLELSRAGQAQNRGVGRLVTEPADERAGDIDIDASLDGLITAKAQRRPPSIEDLRVQRWQRPDTALCLLVDRSGSMSGERLASAALAAAVCAWRAPSQFAVLAFSDRVIEVKPLTGTKPAETVVAEILALRGHGTTDVALALRAAKRQLAGTTARRRITILLSDAEVTAGGDPIQPAKALDELVVIAPEDEPQHARSLIAAAGGRLGEVGGPMSVLDALRTALT